MNVDPKEHILRNRVILDDTNDTASSYGEWIMTTADMNVGI